LKVANALPNPPEVFRDLILDLIFSTTSADRAAILLATGPEDDLTCISSRDRKEPENNVMFSEAVVRLVLKKGAKSSITTSNDRTRRWRPRASVSA
jgi:hypothetical protein